MAMALGIIAGLVVFSIWMNIVGNPHVVETVLGVAIAVITGVFVKTKVSRWLK